MGFLKDKYTKEYFTGISLNGKKLNYGALGAEDWKEGGIFSEIKDPIDSINLEGKTILEIGFGRGESARYILAEKDIKNYIGIDFSDHAYALALETLNDIDSSKYRLECGDALEFLTKNVFCNYFDVVFMLDSIEHIPKHEIQKILPLIYNALNVDGVIVVDTPFYGRNEDYISQGYIYVEPTSTDLHPCTSGMHCNKYTREGLILELTSCGFKYINDRTFKKQRNNIINKFFLLIQNLR